MKNVIKSKSLVSIILSIAIMFAYVPLNAFSTTSTPGIISDTINHRRTIEQFIYEVREIQNQVFDISQYALDNPPLFAERLAANITRIAENIDSVNKNISDYLATLPTYGDQNAHVLLVLNALNFIKNGLYTLSVLTNTTSDIQRIRLLDEYFRARIASLDTLNTVENLITK